MRYNEKILTYHRGDVVTFRKTRESFGGLSNMASGYPIRVNGYLVRTSEALYQALKYTDAEIQQKIISEKSPMTAKMISKKYAKYIRGDWNDIRISVMKWCLRVKLVSNWGKFGHLLSTTEIFDIVEESHKDRFWGAVPSNSDTLVGRNYLGRLLKQLRKEYLQVNESDHYNLRKPDKFELMFMNQPVRDQRITVEEQIISNINFKEKLQLEKHCSEIEQVSFWSINKE